MQTRTQVRAGTIQRLVPILGHGEATKILLKERVRESVMRRGLETNGIVAQGLAEIFDGSWDMEITTDGFRFKKMIGAVTDDEIAALTETIRKAFHSLPGVSVRTRRVPVPR